MGLTCVRIVSVSTVEYDLLEMVEFHLHVSKVFLQVKVDQTQPQNFFFFKLRFRVWLSVEEKMIQIKT